MYDPIINISIMIKGMGDILCETCIVCVVENPIDKQNKIDIYLKICFGEMIKIHYISACFTNPMSSNINSPGPSVKDIVILSISCN